MTTELLAPSISHASTLSSQKVIIETLLKKFLYKNQTKPLATATKQATNAAKTATGYNCAICFNK